MKKKTKEKIIEASLMLFNEHGEANISTNHISDYLSISPGNLYYYFDNKEAIIRAIFELYATDLEDYLKTRPDVNLEGLIYYFDGLFTLMWNYRFIYLNFTNIIIRDPELHKMHAVVSDQVHAELIKLLNAMREAELLVLDDNYLPHFAQTVKVVTNGWLPFYVVQNPGFELSPKAINSAVTQLAYLFLPIATEKGSELLNVIADYYNNLIHNAPSTE